MAVKPSGEYEDRMLQGAWPGTKPEDRYSLQRDIAQRADQTRDQHAELRANAHQLKDALQSDGFDALHADRAKTDRNYDLLHDEQRSLHDWTGRSGDVISAIQSKMAADVHTAMGLIKAIDADPLLEESEKEAAREVIVRETNVRLIAENVAAGKVVSGDFARHMALAESLPYFMSKADPTPYAPTQSNGGASMMKFSKGPPMPGKGGDGDLPGKGDGPGKGTENKLPSKNSEPGQAPGKTKEPSLPESKKPGVGSAAGKGLEPKLPASESPAPTGSSSGASSPLGVPGGGGSGGGVPGSGGAGSPTSALGGLGGMARGAPPTPGNLTSANPAAANPLASATPAAASALSSGSGARPAVPASPVQAAPVSANPQSQAMPPQSSGGATQVVPAGNTSANAPQTVTATPHGPAQGPLGQAPPLSGAPPPPAGAVSPGGSPGMSGAQGGVTAGPAGAPLPTGVPVVGTPLVRNGILEKAEDPDLALARDLIFQLLWASRRYPSLDWAIGIHRIGDVSTFFVTSSEGLCYIPAHVFLPDMAGLVPLFHDVQVARPTWSVLWQGWADPARPVAQHHRLRSELYGHDALYAIVSSRSFENIEHVVPPGTVLEFCDPEKNQYINAEKAHEIAELAPGQLHRLAVASPDLWSLATQVPANDRWSTAVDLVGDAVLATNFRQVLTGVVYSDEPVPVNDPYSDALDHVLGPIHSGMDVDVSTWQRLNMAYYTHLMQAQSARHTPHDLTDDTGYVDMYRRARAYEAAQLLNQPPGPLPDTWLADIAYCHFAATANVQRTGDLMFRRLAAQPA